MWRSDRAGGKRLSVAAVVAVLGVAVAWAQPATGQTTQPPPPKCENFSCQDPLFTVDYPAKDTLVTSHGVEVHLPVQFYDSRLFFLFGKGDLGFLTRLTAGTGYQPLRTEDGRGIVAFDFNDWTDTNIGRYHEAILVVPVSLQPVTMDTSANPYELAGAFIDSKNRVFVAKLVVDNQIAIDVGREYYRLDKEPTPEVITSDITTSRARFSATDPQGHPVFSGDFPIDTSPGAQAKAWSQFGSTSGFQGWLAGAAVRGGVGVFNYLSHDVFDPSVILHSHAAGRATTNATGLSLGAVGKNASFSAHPVTDFGKLLFETRFSPQVDMVFENGRWVLAKGSAPATEPGAGGSAEGGAVTSTPAMGHLGSLGTVAP